MKRIDPRLMIPFMALVLAAMACTMGAQPTPTAEPLVVPTISTNTGSDTEDETASDDDVEDEADEEDNETEDTSGTGSNTGANSGSNSGANLPAPALLPSCSPRTDWGTVYTVVRGDTLASIARRAGTDFRTLAAGNCLADPNAIETGQVLRLPGTVTAETVRIMSNGQYTLSSEGYVTIYGTSTGLPRQANIRVQLIDGNGTKMYEEGVLTQGTDIGSGGAGDWQARFYIGTLTNFPTGSANSAAISVRSYGFNAAGNVAATDFRNAIITDPDAAPPSNNPDWNVTIDSVEVGPSSNPIVTIRGMGRGLFEGNVIVEVYNSSNQMMLQTPTTVETDQIGGEGPWSLSFDADGKTSNGTGYVRAYATSPRDGSVVTEDRRNVSFNFTGASSGSVEIQWSPWDQMITPNDQGEFPVSGRVEDGGGREVHVEVLNTGAQIVAQRTVTTDSSGYWYVSDMTINTASVGSHTIRATLVEGGASASQRVIVTERPQVASHTFTNGSYTIVAPDGWYAIGDAGSVGYATHPANDFPPGAGEGPYTQMIFAGTQPYDDGRSVESIVQNIMTQSPSSDATRENVTLADGTPGVLVRYTGGTGKALYSLVIDSGQDFVIAGGQGRGDVVVPLLLRMTINE